MEVHNKETRKLHYEHIYHKLINIFYRYINKYKLYHQLIALFRLHIILQYNEPSEQGHWGHREEWNLESSPACPPYEGICWTMVCRGLNGRVSLLTEISNRANLCSWLISCIPKPLHVSLFFKILLKFSCWVKRRISGSREMWVEQQ